jgi:transcriptional regulator with GAF, ATPase, and Fis domain
MPSPEGFDSITEVASDDARYKRVAMRQQPRVAWTDERGSHEVLLSGRGGVGAAAGNLIEIADATVSRIHAELEPRDGAVWVRDLGSRNGTFVSNVRVAEAEIPDGGTLVVGRTTLSIERRHQPTAVDLWPSHKFEQLVGRSVVMRELFARLSRVAKLESTVLLQGETGTGKEVVAEAIHFASPRAKGPFIVVDCAALPETLLEAELFGHVKGAFTGATTSREGAFQEADGGTLLLDEIGELPADMQPKLLRAVETRTVRRVGESTHRKVDVRIMASTHRDLRTMVNSGAFREDLYFRLAVVPVLVPPLRERTEDIDLLVRRFVGQGHPSLLDSRLIAELTSRSWPGNVRELRNFVERYAALGADEALSSALPRGNGAQANAGLPAVTLDHPFKRLREHWVNHLEREYVTLLLERHGRNVSVAATAAGLDRTYLHRLMRKHGI